LKYKSTFQLIVDILSFQKSSEFTKQQIEYLEVPWEDVIRISSNHLVLPALYFRLKSKGLLQLLPDELGNYLKTIATINRNRNLGLIDEAHHITSILDNHNIEHVYLKGMATLIGGYYEDLGERMITDIDILIKPNKTNNAFELVKEMGYSKIQGFDYEVKNFRHLPKLIDENKLAAVEIHDNILTKNKRQLIDLNKLFSNSRKQKSFRIPDLFHLNSINILTTQINNNNYYYNRINIKNLYDSMILDLDRIQFDKSQFFNNKYIEAYICLYNYWTTKTDSKIYKRNILLRRYFYGLKIRQRLINSIIYITNKLYLDYTNRISLFIKNKSYRNHVIKNKLSVKTKRKLIS